MCRASGGEGQPASARDVDRVDRPHDGDEFSRELKLEAVKLVGDRGVSVSQAARDLDLHENVLRKRVREQATDPGSAFSGHEVVKPESQEIERLRRELARMKAERDI